MKQCLTRTQPVLLTNLTAPTSPDFSEIPVHANVH